MSQQLLRPLRQWPWLVHHRGCVALQHHHHILTSPRDLTKTTTSTSRRFSLAPHAISRRNLRMPNVPPPTTTELEDPEHKSRNQLKREAKRAVKWGMDLASFSAPQIKRILRVVSLGQVAFEAIMLVKRLGPDVREGRRRQFNYIGKLLRDVEPELMDRLIRATEDSDHKELQALTGLGSDDLNNDNNDDLIETESEDDEEESNWHDSQAARWFDGLISKDIQITNEVYSIQDVEFDRQELRKLVRKVHLAREKTAANEEDEKKIETAVTGAKKALNRFLRGISKRIPDEY